MSITDELRRYAANWDGWFYDDKDGGLIHTIGHDPIQSTPVPKVINDIADRIDERHAKARDKAYNEGVCDGIDADKNAIVYIKLPVDADGVPIRVGDVMEWPTTGETFEVVGISANTLFYIEHDFDDSAQWTAAYDKRHHHEPTVEDVLREFAEKMNENMGMYTGEAIDADEWRDADRQTIAEYASKLRLAGEGE